MRPPGHRYQNQNGLIVLYAKSPCKWASRAAGIVGHQRWQINDQNVVIVHRRWPRSFRRQFRKAIPEAPPLYRIPGSAELGWLGKVRISPVFFQLDPDGVVLDWAIRVPGDDGPAWKSKLGSLLHSPDER